MVNQNIWVKNVVNMNLSGTPRWRVIQIKHVLQLIQVLVPRMYILYYLHSIYLFNFNFQLLYVCVIATQRNIYLIIRIYIKSLLLLAQKSINSLI